MVRRRKQIILHDFKLEGWGHNDKNKDNVFMFAYALFKIARLHPCRNFLKHLNTWVENSRKGQG